MNKLIQYFPYLLIINGITGAVLPNILWDPRNYLFSCKNLEINIRPGQDFLPFVCPRNGLNTKALSSEGSLYEKVYVLYENQKEQINSCNSTGAYMFLDCNDPRKYIIRSEQFPTEKIGKNTFVYKPGTTYHFLSTSFRTAENLDKRINGSCQFSDDSYFPLKLAVRICGKGESDVTCPVCNSFECYTKGCGVWGDWRGTSRFYWNGSQCFQKYTRVCDNSKYFKCEGPTQTYKAANKENCTFEVCTSRSTTLPVKTSKAVPTCSAVVTTSTVNITVIQPTTAIRTTFVTETKSVVISTVIANKTETKTVTETTTDVTTVTGSASITTVTLSVSKCPPNAGKIVYVSSDIPYDKKFYITVCAAIIAAILVGIFAMHAIVSYCEGKRLYTKVYLKDQMKSEADSKANGSSYVEKKNTSEQVYEQLEMTEIVDIEEGQPESDSGSTSKRVTSTD